MLTGSGRFFTKFSFSVARIICTRCSTTLSGAQTSLISISEEISTAVKENAGVVALESTVITHGMPYPENLKTAKRLEKFVRDGNCVPATVAILDGKIRIGLTEQQLERLAASGSESVKISRRDLSASLVKNVLGGTTVSATMIVAQHAGIPVFATGGIGGVHRDFIDSFDVSADLTELGRTQVAVVCAGVKSILDVPKTLEYLETEGVPVITYGDSLEFPGFYTKRSGCKAAYCFDNAFDIAHVIKNLLDLRLKNGILIGVPIPNVDEAIGEEIESAIKIALSELKNINISGRDVTPHVLKRVNEITNGHSLQLNVQLLENNVKHAAKIAEALAVLRKTLGCTKVVVDSKPTQSHVIKSSKPDVVVFGGSVIDCYADTDKDERLSGCGQGVNGRVHMSVGGVGRNHADALQRLGIPTHFVSVVGCDDLSVLFKKCEHMDLSGVKFIADAPTASYVAYSIQGSLCFGVCSSDIFQHLTPEMVDTAEEKLSTAKLCFIDANLPIETLAAICTLCSELKVPVWYDPSDSHLADKIIEADCWNKIAYVSPNWLEFQSITNRLGINMDDSLFYNMTDLEPFYKALIRNSDKFFYPEAHKALVLTMSASGVVIMTKIENKCILTHFDAPTVPPTGIVNVSGAGDCLNCGIIFGLINKLSIIESVSVGTSLARLSLQSREAVPRTDLLKFLQHDDKRTVSVRYQTSFKF